MPNDPIPDYYTITQDDVSRPSIRAFGKVWMVAHFIGRILTQDVGKRVYLRGGILEVESREQFEARTQARTRRTEPASNAELRAALIALLKWATGGDKTGNPYRFPEVINAIRLLSGDPKGYDIPKE